jgi:hypothetical protein
MLGAMESAPGLRSLVCFTAAFGLRSTANSAAISAKSFLTMNSSDQCGGDAMCFLIAVGV